MTKKHFEYAAKLIREANYHVAERAAAAQIFADVAREFNPRFDARKFFKACGL